MLLQFFTTSRTNTHPTSPSYMLGLSTETVLQKRISNNKFLLIKRAYMAVGVESKIGICWFTKIRWTGWKAGNVLYCGFPYKMYIATHKKLTELFI
jgi:hypothetical protein